MTPRARDPAVRPSCPGMAQMALATESDSRNRSLPQHGRGRDSAQVSITVRPSCPGMAQMALCHRIGQPKPSTDSDRPTQAPFRNRARIEGSTAMPGRPVPKAAEIWESRARNRARIEGSGPIPEGNEKSLIGT